MNGSPRRFHAKLVTPRRFARGSTSVLLAGVFALSGVMQAQTAAPGTSAAPRNANATETIELSPFIITETTDTGWVATETLAGTRLRTELKDVPNQIETLTKEFMQDLGLNDVDSALIYSSNTDNQSENLVNPGEETQFPTSTGRVRGIGTGGATLYQFPQVRANSEVRASVWGVAVFTLASGGYQWEFVPVAGAGFRDSGSGVCH